MFTSDEFTFPAPPGWTRAPEAERLTFIDERGGVLIVSSTLILSSAPATPDQWADVLKVLLSNAFAAVQHAASDPELLQVAGLHESPHPSLRCWTAEARWRDGTGFFSQCVLASQRAVLLATLETPPPAETHRELFRGFVDGVGSAAGS